MLLQVNLPIQSCASKGGGGGEVVKRCYFIPSILNNWLDFCHKRSLKFSLLCLFALTAVMLSHIWNSETLLEILCQKLFLLTFKGDVAFKYSNPFWFCILWFKQEGSPWQILEVTCLVGITNILHQIPLPSKKDTKPLLGTLLFPYFRLCSPTTFQPSKERAFAALYETSTCCLWYRSCLQIRITVLGVIKLDVKVRKSHQHVEQWGQSGSREGWAIEAFSTVPFFLQLCEYLPCT